MLDGKLSSRKNSSLQKALEFGPP